jgi:hypothetical protein
MALPIDNYHNSLDDYDDYDEAPSFEEPVSTVCDTINNCLSRLLCAIGLHRPISLFMWLCWRCA